MVDKQYNLGFCSCDVKSINLYKSEHYNYASIGIKRGKSQYVSISYEWEGEVIPDFILEMASFFSTSEGDGGMVTASIEDKADIEAFKQRLSNQNLV